jgi:hypothetical protein
MHQIVLITRQSWVIYFRTSKIFSNIALSVYRPRGYSTLSSSGWLDQFEHKIKDRQSAEQGTTTYTRRTDEACSSSVGHHIAVDGKQMLLWWATGRKQGIVKSDKGQILVSFASRQMRGGRRQCSSDKWPPIEPPLNRSWDHADAEWPRHCHRCNGPRGIVGEFEWKRSKDRRCTGQFQAKVHVCFTENSDVGRFTFVRLIPGPVCGDSITYLDQ